MPEQLLDLANGFFAGHERHPATLLPDPPRAERFHTIISADDHLVEPADLWTSRLPRRYRHIGPRIARMKGRLDPSVTTDVVFIEDDGKGLDNAQKRQSKEALERLEGMGYCRNCARDAASALLRWRLI